MIKDISKTMAIFWVEADKVCASPLQPRENFDEKELKELAESIRQYGIIQPLVVIRKEKEAKHGFKVEYELIAGERRWRAAKMAGLKQIPVVIRPESADRVRLELSLVENLQREDLNAIERAKAFRVLTSDFSYSSEDIAFKIGKSREFVSNSLRLLSLPEEIQSAVKEGKISEGHGRALLMVNSSLKNQKELFLNIIKNPVSVREVEKMARAAKLSLTAPETVETRTGAEIEFKPEIENLEKIFNSRIAIEKQNKVLKISFELSGDEELKNFIKKISS